MTENGVLPHGDCTECGHTRAAHSFALRCHHVGCECEEFIEHRGADHKGVVRDCIQDWHFCGARDGIPPKAVAPDG